MVLLKLANDNTGNSVMVTFALGERSNPKSFSLVKNHSQIYMGHMFLGVEGSLFELPTSLTTWSYLASLHLRHLRSPSILYLLICVAFLFFFYIYLFIYYM